MCLKFFNKVCCYFKVEVVFSCRSKLCTSTIWYTAFSMQRVFVCFLEESMARKKCFEIIWPLKTVACIVGKKIQQSKRILFVFPWTMSKMVKYKGSELIKIPKSPVFHHVWNKALKNDFKGEIASKIQFRST